MKARYSLQAFSIFHIEYQSAISATESTLNNSASMFASALLRSIVYVISCASHSTCIMRLICGIAFSLPYYMIYSFDFRKRTWEPESEIINTPAYEEYINNL